MIRLIVNLIILIVLALLIGFNSSYRTTINFFGTSYDDVSLVAVILLSIVVGALYALFAFFSYSVGRRRRVRQKGRTLENRQRETLLDERERGMDGTDRDHRKGTKSPRPRDTTGGIPDTP